MPRTRVVFSSIVAAAALLAPTGVHAAVDVVATTSSGGMLARTVGGSAVKVTVLAPPDRDAHFLQAKPGMMLAVRRAKLLVAIGAELEVGWLPAVLEGAGNPGVLPGQPGYFELAAQVDLIEKGAVADRSKGDVHPTGNPHVYTDPVRMAQAATALAGRLAAIDPAHVVDYSARAIAFERLVRSRLAEWKQKAAGAPGVVFFHKDGNYLAQLLGVQILGYVEPLPGFPPTASHLRGLVRQLKGRPGVVLYASFQPSQGPAFLAHELGWRMTQLPLEPAMDADAAGYLDLIGRWVDAIAAAGQ